MEATSITSRVILAILLTLGFYGLALGLAGGLLFAVVAGPGVSFQVSKVALFQAAKTHPLFYRLPPDLQSPDPVVDRSYIVP